MKKATDKKKPAKEKPAREKPARGKERPPKETYVAEVEDESPGRWQKWVFLFIAAADLVNVITNMFALAKLFDIRRVLLILVWLIAAVCFGIAAFCCWKEEKKQKEEQPQEETKREEEQQQEEQTQETDIGGNNNE